jgi:hypothetical protein
MSISTAASAGCPSTSGSESSQHDPITTVLIPMIVIILLMLPDADERLAGGCLLPHQRQAIHMTNDSNTDRRGSLGWAQ